MSVRSCLVEGPGDAITLGEGHPLAIIAGPCVLEDEALSLRIGETVAAACADLGLRYIFKASFDKANRSSVRSPRGPGIGEGLAALAAVRERLGVPVTTDVHAPEQADAAAAAVDILQIPAFLSRQTDLLVAAAEAARDHRRTVNVKKGQFLSPREMAGPVEKVRAAGCDRVIVTERGTFFGYHRLVNDFIGVGDLIEGACFAQNPRPAVCFDATHSVQLPGEGVATGGRRDRVPLLAQAAVAAGVDVVFIECHPDPERAPSDGSNMLPLDAVPDLLRRLAEIHRVVGGSAIVSDRPDALPSSS